MATVVAGAAVGAGTASAADPAAVAAPPVGATVVGTASATCANPTVATINAAITAATAGDTIYVCPGTYPESVKVTKKLTLLGAQHGVTATSGRTDTTQETIITAPFGGGDDIDYVGNVNGTVDGFTLTGNGNTVPGRNIGIFASQAGSSYTFANNVVTGTTQGIIVGSTAGSTTMTGNRITGSITEAGTEATNGIDFNGIFAAGVATPAGFSNNVTIDNNVFGGNGADINTGGGGTGLVVTNNTSVDSENFLTLFNTKNAKVSNNKTSATPANAAKGFTSFYISGGNDGATVSNNQVSGGGSATGIGLNGQFYTPSTNTTVTGNTITNRSDGVRVSTSAKLTAGTTISNNVVTGSSANGLRFDADSSTGVAVTGNTATGSVTTDCLDSTKGTGTAGTANTWTNDRGITSNPAGLCSGLATVAVNVPAQLTAGGAPVAFTGTATNTGPAISNARYDIAFTGDAGLTAGQITLQYQLPDGSFGTVPLTGSTANGGTIAGYFGPFTGFPFPAGANPTTNFKISIAAGAPTGALTSVVTLDTVNPTTGAVTATLATSAPKTTQIVAAPPGGAYDALTPQRITDTRTGSGQPNTGKTLPSNGTLDVQVPTNSVPAGATAVALSITAVDATSPGFLNAYPTGATANTTSVVNFVPGAPGCTTPDCVVPNLVIAQISSSGQLTIHNGPAIGGSVDVVVDLQGYFSTTGAVSSGEGHYNTTAPTRVADTRCGETPPVTGAGDCTAIPAGNKTLKTLTTSQSVDVAVAGQGTIPATGLSAAVVQLTTTNPTTNGYLTAYPTGTTRPTASNVNWVVGQTTSNRAIVPLDASGKLSLYNFSGNTDVVVDVVGYFSDSTASPTAGALFTPVNPGRVVDTRDPGGAPLGANQSRAVQVGNVAGIPAVVSGSPTAAALNLTEATATANSFLTVTPTAITPPAATSDLNFGPGEVRANADLASLPSTGKISIYNLTGDTDAVMDAFGYFSSAAPPATN